MTAPVERSEIDRLLRQSKRTELAAQSEITFFSELRLAQSPWAGARRIRIRALAVEIEADLRRLESYRRDLGLRLRLAASAVQAARAYAQATKHQQG